MSNTPDATIKTPFAKNPTAASTDNGQTPTATANQTAQPPLPGAQQPPQNQTTQPVPPNQGTQNGKQLQPQRDKSLDNASIPQQPVQNLDPQTQHAVNRAS